MLRHDVSVQHCRIVINLDLQVADRVAGVEWAEQGDECIHDGLTARQFGKVQPKLFSRGSEIKIQSSVNADASESASPWSRPKA
jgi:hypothetical protein